jgi:hypothetical protein
MDQNAQTKFLHYLALIVLLCLSCMAIELPGSIPVNTPPESPTAFSFPTQIPNSSPTRIPTATTAPVPSWVAEFANPILIKLAGRQPDYKDDFSGFNQGWFYLIPESQINPHYAQILGGVLTLKIPNGKETRDAMVYNPKLAHQNFVLSFDFKFGKTQPNDVLRFQFSQTTGQSVWLDLSKNEDWSFDWGLHGQENSASGTYYYFSPERINVAIIMQGNECAVYLNHDPLDHMDNCRDDPNARLSSMAMSLHLLSTTGHDASVTIDNMKFWNLDKVPDLP